MLRLIESIKRSPFSLPVLSGILCVLIQPPLSLSFLAFFAFIPLFYSLNNKNFRQSFMAGCISGIVSYLGLIYWIIVAVHKYGGINVYLSFLILLMLILYVAFYTGCFTLAISYLEKRLDLPFYLSAPPVWVVLEYLRGTLITGFPWSYLSHSQYNFLPFIQVISITGAYFISFLIIAINGIIYYLWKRKKISLIYSAGISLLFIASLIYGFIETGKKDTENQKVAIIQGNVSQEMKWDEASKLKTIRTYYQRTLEAGSNVDLVLWPETAMPFIFDQEIHVNKYIKALPSLTGALILFGTISRDTGGRFYNTAYVLGKNDQETGRYYKAHLVPFGEYTPLRHYLPFLEKLSVQIGEIFPGQTHAPIRTKVGNIGVLICYEGIFPYITNETVRKGAQVLVNITNDAWYDRTSAPYQHLAFYVFRAIESDRYVLRAANTGISAIIDPKGRIHGATPIFEERVVKGGYALKDTQTFYVRYGDYFILIALCYLAVIIGGGIIKRQSLVDSE
ncbi:MAG: apolipoprotein N-acyltransferase [Syntrophus sp. (in: bacteria)]|nr:apolipoprotein N-acyltransferase [Syntrophus sp. (in: bacteria)]